MKQFISILMLALMPTSQAALNDAYSMIQISQGTWRVTCQDQSITQVTTREILNQQLCGTTTPTNPQACFDATVSGMRSYEYDELSEIQEINQLCSQGNQSTGSCIATAKSGLKSYEFDEREEGLEIVKACTLGLRRGRNNPRLSQCMTTATKVIKSYEYDERSEIIEIIHACGMGNSQTVQCVNNTTSNLRSYDYDERDEIIAIIASCS